MFGDDTEPLKLFDPDREAPPLDAVDVLFVSPVSLSLLAQGLADDDRQCDHDRLRDLYLAAARGTVADVQHYGGYVTGGHQGDTVPGRLQLTAVVERVVPGVLTWRLHTHLYVGRRGVALDTGEYHPVALDRLARAADNAWSNYLGRLVDDTTRELSYVWQPLPGHHPADEEIVFPAPEARIANAIRGACPGTYGPREQIRADAQARATIASMAPYLPPPE